MISRAKENMQVFVIGPEVSETMLLFLTNNDTGSDNE